MVGFHSRVVFAVMVIIGLGASVLRAGNAFDLSHVDGIESFEGSAEAQQLLAGNGFVVAEPGFRQIFEPYIKSPLPVFITPDSAWHTYHLILEEGVKKMERSQADSLARFSRLLLDAAGKQASGGASEFREIAEFASIGLAFQDRAFAAGLDPAKRQTVDALNSDAAGPVAAPIGFPLSGPTFRPQSFYTESAELKAYYQARQWYASVDFRLSEGRETRLALCLSWLIGTHSELLEAWRGLCAPYDRFVATPEDASVADYYEAETKVLGTNFGFGELNEHAEEIAKALRANPKAPRINDQVLSPGEYEHFARVTAGFRLLPARQLPCAVCLQNAVDPKIPGRFCPSGLDFFAGSAVLRSPASLRAEEAQFGRTVLEGVRGADPGPMPESLYGQSMELLTILEKPLPARAPAPFRSEAWADLQLWTQLGAWAEQRHTWALHAKPNLSFMGLSETPPGVVAPYPEFFSGLARLSRQTAAAFEAGVPARRFDARQTAAELLLAEETAAVLQEKWRTGAQPIGTEPTESVELMARYDQFRMKLSGEATNPLIWDAREVRRDVLERCAASGSTNALELRVLRAFFDVAAPKPSVQLTNFAGVCDRLADLAGKELAGKIPTREEADWISGYGQALAGFHGYEGNSWLEPADDFPIVSRIFGNLMKGTVLYAGVGRPQALYVILPYKDRTQLYRGAVLSYREFEQPESKDMSDAAWQDLATRGEAPPPPAFTRSFLDSNPPDANQKKRLQALSFAGGDLVKAPTPRVQVSLGQSVLAPMPAHEVPGYSHQMMSSDDERHVIYVEQRDGKECVVRDGIAGREYDQVEAETFSPDSRHIAYVASKGGAACVVKDGVEGKWFERILELGNRAAFVFSPDGAHLAYMAGLRDDKKCMVVDCLEGPVYDRIPPNSFSFSGNSHHYIYAGANGDRIQILKDHKVVLESGNANRWEEAGQAPMLSPSGKRFATPIMRDSQWHMNVDGTDGPAWDKIDDSRFSPDGSHFTYRAERRDQLFDVMDGREIPSAAVEGAVFSEDGKNWALPQVQENGIRVIVNGKPGKLYDGYVVLHLTFSPNGRRLAYWVAGYMGRNMVTVVHDEQEFEDVRPGTEKGICFSPDSKHVAISGLRGNRSVVIIDGKQYPCSDVPDWVGEVTFSPSSDRWAYQAFHGGKMYWVISGTEYGPYDPTRSFNPGSDEGIMSEEEVNLFFSPDSRHFVFRTGRGGQHFLVVDGVEQEVRGDWFPHSVVVFDSPRRFHFIVEDSQEISVVKARIEAQ